MFQIPNTCVNVANEDVNTNRPAYEYITISICVFHTGAKLRHSDSVSKEGGQILVFISRQDRVPPSSPPTHDPVQA